jgi:osmoprotectant transport system ATP-binding protein
MSCGQQLSVSGLAKVFAGNIEAVCDVSFQVGPGELIALVGESGCGKTTTLKCINRLLEPSGGEITLGGEDIQELDPVTLRRRIGWIMQGDGLFPHFTVAENIAVVPRLLNWGDSEIESRVRQLIELVRLDPDEYADRFPDALSGGQRQRIGIARALAARPGLILMDEPFGALDPITRDELRDDIVDLKDRLGFAAVMVTHDMAEALLLADRVAVMHAGEVVQYGTPEDLLNAPVDERVERMLGSPIREAERISALRKRST